MRQAIALKPDFPHLHEDLGSILAMQQRFEEAVAVPSRGAFGSSRICRSRTKARPGARSARPRPRGRCRIRGILRAGSQDRARSRSRSITCARAQGRGDRDAARRACARTRTTSTPCAASRKPVSGQDQRLSRRRGACCAGSRDSRPDMRRPGCCSAACCTSSDRHRGVHPCYQPRNANSSRANAAALVGPRQRTSIRWRYGEGRGGLCPGDRRCTRTPPGPR